jgi:uncharacterized repeat protein (TIGR01451 family)
MSPSSTYYSDGVIYFFSIFLGLGTHTYHFEFNDSRVDVRAPSTIGGEYDGPEVINRAPLPVLNKPVDGAEFNTGSMIKFDASSTTDPDGDTIELELYSNLDGLLGKDTIVSTNLTAGDHTITLTVTDSLNATSSVSIDITVIQLVPNLNKIDIAIAPENPVEGETVTVKASITNSGDATANNVEVTLYLDESSIFDDTVSNIEKGKLKSIETTFTATPGEHELKVEILDGIDNTLTFSVLEREVPIAVAGEDITINENEKAGFDGSNSNSSGTIVSYFWDYGDGTNGSGISVSHIYKNKGKYSVKLTVTDELGKQDSDMLTVTVLAKESSDTDEFDMGSLYLPILLVIIIIVIALVFILLKRRPKKEKPEDYFTSQGAVVQQPAVQAQGYQPPPDAKLQQDLQTIAPPPDLVVERPEDDYYHPQHEHYTPTDETEHSFDDSYINFEPQDTQETAGAEDFSAMLPEESPEPASPQVETETVSTEPGTPPPKPQPQPTISKKPKIKTSANVPKIVHKDES